MVQVQADVQHRGVVVEVQRGPVAEVDVDVDHRDPVRSDRGRAVLRGARGQPLHVPDCHRRLVEHAATVTGVLERERC